MKGVGRCSLCVPSLALSLSLSLSLFLLYVHTYILLYCLILLGFAVDAWVMRLLGKGSVEGVAPLRRVAEGINVLLLHTRLIRKLPDLR